MINQIANMALVEWSDNIKISDKPPGEYWPAQVAEKRKTAGLTDERLARQVGWHCLPDGWQAMEYQEFLAARRRLMAVVVRDAYGLLTSDAYQAAYPAPVAAPTGDGAKGWTGYGISVRNLLDAGLLGAVTQLLPAQDDLDVVAEVLPDGRTQLDGDTFDSPSCAAHAARRMATNGWTFWVADTVEGPRRLSDLRDEVLRDSA